jgi:hypothetical protein
LEEEGKEATKRKMARILYPLMEAGENLMIHSSISEILKFKLTCAKRCGRRQMLDKC